MLRFGHHIVTILSASCGSDARWVCLLYCALPTDQTSTSKGRADSLIHVKVWSASCLLYSSLPTRQVHLRDGQIGCWDWQRPLPKMVAASPESKSQLIFIFDFSTQSHAIWIICNRSVRKSKQRKSEDERRTFSWVKHRKAKFVL